MPLIIGAHCAQKVWPTQPFFMLIEALVECLLLGFPDIHQRIRAKNNMTRLDLVKAIVIFGIALKDFGQ